MSINKVIDRMIEQGKQSKYCLPDNACLRLGDTVKGKVSECMVWRTCEANRLNLCWRGNDINELPNYVIHNHGEQIKNTSQTEIDEQMKDFYKNFNENEI